MSRIFFSHSSADEREAIALRQWLADQGWNDVFLDIDPQRGLVPGERWQGALRRAADRCEVVVVIVSPAWAGSKWCLAEFLLAKSLNKRILAIALKPVLIGDLPTELTAEWQLGSLIGSGRHETVRFRHRDQRIASTSWPKACSACARACHGPASTRITSRGHRRTTPSARRIVA